jgi:hypothetical protein
MASEDCSTLLASVEVLGPANKLVVNTRMFFSRKYDQILTSIVERVTVFMMNDAAIWNGSDNMLMFKDPAGFSLSKSISISAFASSDSYRSDRIFLWPAFAMFFTPLRSAFRRACNAAQRSISFKELSANRTPTEVLSHATE